jgi:hypothetical protein
LRLSDFAHCTVNRPQAKPSVNLSKNLFGMAAGANNGMQAFLDALVNELSEPKVANFLKGMGLRLSAENLLPAGSWPKGSNVMDEMMEGTLLSVLSELPAPVTFSTYDTGTGHNAGTTANWIQLHGLAITEHVMIASRALNSSSPKPGLSLTPSPCFASSTFVF